MIKFRLDANGDPVRCDDVIEWARWYEGAKEQTILGRAELGPFVVSTVFLAIDHGWAQRAPILWETMIFGPERHRLNGYQERYTSRVAALEGHDRAVALVAQAVNPCC